MEMIKDTYELELPAVYEVAVQRGEAKVEIDVGKLSDAIIAKLAIHGLRQKIADAAAGAKKVAEAEDETRTVPEIAHDLMAKVVKTLESGEWGVERGVGTSTDPLDKYRLEVMREVMRVNPGLKKKYEAIDSSDQSARRDLLLAVARKNAEMIDAEAERRKEVADAAAKAAKGIELEI